MCWWTRDYYSHLPVDLTLCAGLGDFRSFCDAHYPAVVSFVVVIFPFGGRCVMQPVTHDAAPPTPPVVIPLRRSQPTPLPKFPITGWIDGNPYSLHRQACEMVWTWFVTGSYDYPPTLVGSLSWFLQHRCRLVRCAYGFAPCTPLYPPRTPLRTVERRTHARCSTTYNAQALHNTTYL